LTEDLVKIKPQWVQFWSDPTPSPLGGEGRGEGQEVRTVLAIDPAVTVKESADASALVVLQLTADKQIRCREAKAVRLLAPDLLVLIEQMERRWNPEAILFESNAGFKGMKDLLVRHASFGPKVKGITQSGNKGSRVIAFSIAVENGSFLLMGKGGVVDASQRELFDEMTLFPTGEHDDLLDAAAMGTEYLLATREPRIWCF
jgi:predicted phage terminase large subunit-like protein